MNDRRRHTKIQFLIATIPDPVDSGLPHMFDRFLGSIQEALQQNGYVLSAFELPWQDCLLGRGQNSKKEDENDDGGDDNKNSCEEKLWIATSHGVEPRRRIDLEPGVLLLSNSSAVGETDLLLLYLIGETPTSGIHKEAMAAALNEVSWFCGWRVQALPRPQSCPEIRILGPTFSGSAQSLDFALSSWLESNRYARPVSVRIISGSATVIDAKRDFYNVRGLYQDRQDASFSFSSTEAPTAVSYCELLKYLKQVEPDEHRRRIALLRESGTVYGKKEDKKQEEQRGKKEEQKPQEKEEEQNKEKKFTCSVDETEVTSIFFPLHISQLRAASERVRQSQQPPTAPMASTPQGLPLEQALAEVNQPKKSIPPFSALDPLSAEQVVAQLLSTISREGYRYVGILATDVRDTIFLANELHEHSPATVLFALDDADLLFLHGEENPKLRGMLLVSSYPLFAPNQLWSPPHPPHGSHVRMQFPEQAPEGVYNAALALLGTNDRMVEYGLPFEPEPSQPPLWITVVGRNRMWPLELPELSDTNDSADLNKISELSYFKQYMFDATPEPNPTRDANLTLDQKKKQKSGKEKEAAKAKEEAASWWLGLYPEGTVIFITGFATFCIVFCMPLLRRSEPPPAGPQDAQRSGFWQTALDFLQGSWLKRVLGETVSEKHRRRGELYLLVACAILGAFLALALTAVLVPVMVLGARSLPVAELDLESLEWLATRIAFAGIWFASVVAILAASRSLLPALKPRTNGKPDWKMQWAFWGLIVVGALAVVVSPLGLAITWISRAWTPDEFRGLFAGVWPLQPRIGTDESRALFNSLRALDLLSGVSTLVPLFLISMAGFLWAVSSFHRVRLLECFDSQRGFLYFGRPLPELQKLEDGLREHLERPSLRPPASGVVILLALCSSVYLFYVQLVRSFEGTAFYLLLGVSFFLVNLALWHGFLRFCSVWQETHRLLRHLSLAPMRDAYSRLRESFPALPKIDLATPAPSLARLQYSVDQARTLCQHASRLVEARTAGEGKFRLELAVGGTALEAQGKTESALTEELSKTERLALQLVGSEEMRARVQAADNKLRAACEADATGDWRKALSCQWESQAELSEVAAGVAEALDDGWWNGPWNELHGTSNKSEKTPPSKAAQVFQLGEEFLAGRVAHFLAYVFPQMQNLVYTSVCGLLLMLFAISSYPFQPHNLLLLFNWAVILSFVGIAMWVFIEMNRDPVLSSLNGAEAGKINWNWDFAFRIFMYGIVPILALLGAQFPESVGQIVSHIIPSEAMHQ